jgi:serine/threonine protein kinase
MSKPINISFEKAQRIMDATNLEKKMVLCSNIKSFNCEDGDCDNVYSLKNQIGEDSKYGKIFQACKTEQNCSYVAKWQTDIEMALQEAKIQKEISKLGITPKIHQIYTCKEGAIIIMDSLTIAASRLFKSLTPAQLNDTIDHNVQKIDRVIKRYNLNYVINRREIKSVEDLVKLRSTVNGVIFRTRPMPPILDDIETVEDSEFQKVKREMYLTEIFSLLQTLHKTGLIHNDAHLNNFMGDDAMNIKVIDFGLVKRIEKPEDKLIDFKRVLRNILQYTEEGYTNLRYLYELAEEYIDNLN